MSPGVRKSEGDFAEGDVVRICDEDGLEFARGIARVNAQSLANATPGTSEVVHRDDLVVL